MRAVSSSIFLSVLLAGCGTMHSAQLERITLPNGDHGWMIDCSYTGMPACFQTAGSHCPSGYHIYERSGGQPGESGIPIERLPDGVESVLSPEEGGESRVRDYGYRYDKYMIIQCRSNKGDGQ